jgi:DNA-binding NtrC family response regulator
VWAIERGEFRADLYDRLSEIVLEVPPLRDRREDIPLLVAHFLGMYASRHRVTVTGLAPGARPALQAYDWPGNVRELEKAVSRAVIFGDGGWIHIEDLGLAGGARECAPGPVIARGAERGTLSLRQRETLRITAERGTVRRRDLMTRWGISREAARHELAELVERGFLRKIGNGRGARYMPRSGAGPG